MEGHTSHPGRVFFHIKKIPDKGLVWYNGSNSVDTGVSDVSYVPDVDFLGSDHFTYTATDADGEESEQATVYITVVPATVINKITTCVDSAVPSLWNGTACVDVEEWYAKTHC